jgi:hypothetical protein
VDRTADLPFVEGRALAAVALHTVSDTQGIDLVVSYAGRPGVVYRDRLGGGFEAEPLAALPAGTGRLAAADLDGDGWLDLAAGATVLINDRDGGWTARPAPADPLVVVDPGNAGRPRPLGAPRTGSGAGPDARRSSEPSEAPAAALVAPDIDGVGRTDHAAVGGDGVLRRFTGATATANRHLAVRLEGVKNPKLALGAEVEVKAGSL